MKWSEKRGFRFLIAGAVQNIASYAAYLLLLLVTDYRIAYTTSYALGLLLSFVLNSRYVFQVPLRWRRLAPYPLVYLAQYVVGLALIWATVGLLGWPEAIAPAIVMFCTMPLTYFVTRFILGAKPHAPAAHR